MAQQLQTSKNWSAGRRPSSATPILGRIMESLEPLRRRLDADEENKRDRRIKRKLIPTVMRGLPVHLLLPAFPFKSPNTARKVLGELPDKAEELALIHLHEACARISEAYAPGARLTLSSDGRVYADVIGIPDETVNTYGVFLRRLYLRICEARAEGELIDWHSLEDDFPRLSPSAMRRNF